MLGDCLHIRSGQFIEKKAGVVVPETIGPISDDGPLFYLRQPRIARIHLLKLKHDSEKNKI